MATRLFDFDDPPAPVREHEYIKPWAPPAPLDVPLEYVDEFEEDEGEWEEPDPPYEED